MMNAPLRLGTRPVGAAQLAVKDTSTDWPVFAATPKGDGPRPQDRRGGVRTRGAPFTSAQRSRILLTYLPWPRGTAARHEVRELPCAAPRFPAGVTKAGTRTRGARAAACARSMALAALSGDEQLVIFVQLCNVPLCPSREHVQNMAGPRSSHHSSMSNGTSMLTTHCAGATTSCDVSSRTIRTNKAENTFTSCPSGLDCPSSKQGMSSCLCGHTACCRTI